MLAAIERSYRMAGTRDAVCVGSWDVRRRQSASRVLLEFSVSLVATDIAVLLIS